MEGASCSSLLAGCCRAGVGVKVERPQRAARTNDLGAGDGPAHAGREEQQDQPTVTTSLVGMGGGRCAAVRGRPALSWCAGCWPGDMMLDGVTPLAGCVRPLDLLRPTSARAWRQGTGG